MQRRRSPDAIARDAQRLVQYMNTHPDTLLGYARYFGNYEAPASARMTDIDAEGLVLTVTQVNGVEEDLHIKFRARLQASDEVRPMLEEMAREAEEALGLPSTRPPGPPGPGSSSRGSTMSGVHTPYRTPNPVLALIIIVAIVLLLVVAYYPSPPPSFVQAIRDKLGMGFVYGCVVFLVTVHSIEAIGVAAVLLWRGEPDTETLFLWVGSTLLLGIGGFSRMLGRTARMQQVQMVRDDSDSDSEARS